MNLRDFLLNAALAHHFLLLLASEFLLADLFLALLGLLGHTLLAFGEDHLDVARVRHERIDATVCTVSTSAVLGRLVDADVLNKETINVERLEFGVRLGISKKLQKGLARFFRPSALVRAHARSRRELLSLRRAADATVESNERNASLVLDDILEVALRLAQVHALQHLGRLARVFEMAADVFAARLTALGRITGFGHVSSHSDWLLQLFLTR
jgi:hypothetical protein